MKKRILSFVTALFMVFTTIVLFDDDTIIKVSAAEYNPSNAISYAQKYWKNYNSNYSNYNSIGGDCANFVSQCLYAGGLNMDSNWYWYSYSNHSSSWSYCPSMIKYFRDHGYTVIDYASASDIKEGNPVFYWNGNSGNWAHVAICTGHSGNTPLVSAHNKDHWNYEWTLGGANWWGGSTRRATVLLNGKIDCNCSTNNAGRYKVTTSQYPLTIRSGHGTGYSQLGSIPKGTEVYVSKANGSWAHVTYNGISGYVSMQYLTKIQTINAPSGYRIESTSSAYGCEKITVTIHPYDNNITNYKVYFVAPNGNVITRDLGSSNTISAYARLTGTWKVYASISNSGGSYNGSTTNGCVKFKINAPKLGSAVNLGSDFYAYIVHNSSGNVLTNDNNNVSNRKKENSQNQQWHFKRKSDGSYEIESVSKANGHLDANGGKDHQGSNVQVYYNPNDGIQSWKIYSAGNNCYYLMPSFSESAVLDVNNNSSVSGTNVQIWASNLSAAQKFKIEKIGNAKLKLSTNTVNLDLSGTNSATVNVTADGLLPSLYHFNCNRITSAMSTTWGAWSGSTCPLTIKGIKTGSYSITVSLVNGNNNSVVYNEYINIYITCSHKYSSWTTTKSATCTTNGEKQRKCSVCGNVEKKVINSTGHKYTTTVVKPTCTEKGYTMHKCSTCGSYYKDTYTNATGHKYGEWTTTKSATCTTNGEKQRKCSVCKNVEKQVIKATGHKYTTTVVKPTCTEKGYTLHKCSTCGSYYKDTYTNAAGHKYGDWTTTKSATCTTNGEKQRKCSVCGNVEKQVINATGHKYSEQWTVDKEPTETESGSKSHHCEKCGAKKDITEIPSLSHTFGEWIVTIQPTCTEDGEEERICSECYEVETRTIPATEHTYSDEWTIDEMPTCTESGSKSHHCTECDDAIDIIKIPAIGHKYVKVKIVKPTLKSKGYTIYKCSNCGTNIKKDFVPALVSIAKAKITGIKDTTYTGKQIKPSIKVIIGKTVLKNGTDYTVSYGTNKIGKATVKIVGKGKYAGSVVKTFAISPRNTTISVKSLKKGKIRAAIAKRSEVTKYQIQLATNSKFKGAKTVTTTSLNKTLKAKSNKVYYVRVRTMNGKYVSGWSAVKKIKVK